ncbi:hypothetical protein BCR32DRAFT_246065 [Anaeromyces robustus]|uniref:Uncharacterized protein n=1 Tax=Anaeromyces robustus TaxID=1754192 RepID=A0A1Y1X387_9FUNG|nr:hypothetical protein BCR32DRAFT_246065 [Anaeromyces robustus]|eukprot:ORX79856.1 hypothetical protein BCR32DRAFT_246065 [Anaeromyces robustus]
MKFFHLLFFVVIICTLQWETQHNFVNAAKNPENTYFPTNREGYSIIHNINSDKYDQALYIFEDFLFSKTKYYYLKGCRFNPENMAIYCEFKGNKGKSYRVKYSISRKTVTCFPTENKFTLAETGRNALGYISGFERTTGTKTMSRTIYLHSNGCDFNAHIYEFYIKEI